MELYLISFYDANESGTVVHNELYSSRPAADRRYNGLVNRLNCCSWVSLYSTKIVFGRVKADECLYSCDSCNGRYGYYHGDGSDF